MARKVIGQMQNASMGGRIDYTLAQDLAVAAGQLVGKW